MRLETVWAQMDFVLLNSDQFGLVLASLTWDHHPVSLNNQWKEIDGMSHSVGIPITHICLKRQQFTLWLSFFIPQWLLRQPKAWSDWTVFGQLQVDKMIPTLNDSIIITENITAKYQLMASHLHMSACCLRKQNLAFHSYCQHLSGMSWINSQ